MGGPISGRINTVTEFIHLATEAHRYLDRRRPRDGFVDERVIVVISGRTFSLIKSVSVGRWPPEMTPDSPGEEREVVVERMAAKRCLREDQIVLDPPEPRIPLLPDELPGRMQPGVEDRIVEVGEVDVALWLNRRSVEQHKVFHRSY